jgi:hypothetical protein
MLAESCPQCMVSTCSRRSESTALNACWYLQTPLLRSKEKRIFCATCQMYCKREDELTPDEGDGTSAFGVV